MLRKLVSLTSLLWVTTAAKDLLPTDECPLLGPTFSSDFDISKSEAFIQAKEAFPGVIDKLFESGVVNSSISTFVVDVFSSYTNESIYSYSHKATERIQNETFIGEFGDKSIFRVGSVSKLFTLYALLAHTKSLEVFEHPVTEYLPELAGNPKEYPREKIVWEEVTIGALASHQAGTGQFPLSVIDCFNYTTRTESCNVTEHLAALKELKVPSQPLFQGALYSDGGYGVIGRALERMTGTTYHESIQRLLAKPLGLNNTGSFLPLGDDFSAVAQAPYPVSGWGTDVQIVAPSGGIYTNAADMRTMGLSILHNHFLAPEMTRKWMKPHANTASLTWSLGAPWEINRLTVPVSPGSNRTRVIDLYTKAGGNPGYTAIFALDPDHGIGFSVLVAGLTAGEDRWPIRAAVGETFIPAAEHAVFKNAADNFAGTFMDPENEGTNMTLAVEEDHTGLNLTTWFVDNINFKPNVSSPGLVLPEGIGQIIRLYPTGVEFPCDREGSRNFQYRGVREITPRHPRTVIEGGEGLFDDGCKAWIDTAFTELEKGRPNDEFVLEIRDGKVVKVTSPYIDVSMDRVDY